MMNLGIVGSRNYNDYENFKMVVIKVLELWRFKIEDVSNIVSGGSLGVDTLAEKFAEEFQINKIIHPADWNKNKRGAGVIRNTYIVNDSTHMIAFPSHFGKGTQDSIKKAEKKKIPIKILYID